MPKWYFVPVEANEKDKASKNALMRVFTYQLHDLFRCVERHRGILFFVDTNRGVGKKWHDFFKDEKDRPFLKLKLYFMLRWTVTFLIIAIIAAVFGFGSIAAGAASIAKILFFIFIVLFLLSIIAGKSFGKSDL